MIDYGLKNRVAIITGANNPQGIGATTACAFAREGAKVALIYKRVPRQFDKNKADSNGADRYFQANAGGADIVEGRLKEMNADYLVLESDITDESAVKDIYSAVMEKFGRVDVLVNNAGITRDTLMMRMTEQQWDAVITVNLKSAFNFMHAITPVMMRQRSGSIISMSSVVGIGGNAGQCNYSASKAGLIGLTKSMAKEIGPRGVRVNAIAPGFIITEMTAALSEEVRNEWVKTIPLRRGGTPEDVANVALFLASDLSTYVTGQIIHVCGGMS